MTRRCSNQTAMLRALRDITLAVGTAALVACGGGHDDSAARAASAPWVAPASAASGSASPQSAAADQLARGRYLVKAADCAACHTTADGAPFAGGVKLASPFGTFYGTNITPDKEHGIGKWSATDFYKALHDGVAPDGQLYPAMPYTSYRQLSRADTDAMYAWLMTQKPAAVANREAELSFPFSLRFAVRFWDMLFLKDTLPDASKGTSADWNRGRYLANALGHCAECHTPRGQFGQLVNAQPLAGDALGRVSAPDITPHGLAARGWTAADLQTFFATGIAPQGSAFSEMYEVVHLSSQYLSRDDLRAMSTYLLGDEPVASVPLQSASVNASVDGDASADAAQLAAGRNLYLGVCAGCHGRDGEGKPHVAVPMSGNSTLRQNNPHNLIVTMLDGVVAQDFPGHERMQDMPGFGAQLSDAELAQLGNYLRATLGGQPADITPQAVKALR